jgi:hypothetical protein
MSQSIEDTMGSSVGIDDSAATDSKRENVSISTSLSLPFLFRANLLCVRCPLAPAPLSEPSGLQDLAAVVRTFYIMCRTLDRRPTLRGSPGLPWESRWSSADVRWRLAVTPS